MFLNGKMLTCIHLFFNFHFFVFCMSDHILVLSDKNSDLAGHLSFQKKKYIFAALHCYGSLAVFAS